MYLNAIISVLIVLGAILGSAFYIKRQLSKSNKVTNTDSEDDLVTEKNIYTEESLVEITATTINGILRKDYTNQNLSEQELKNKKAMKASLRRTIYDASMGDIDAKNVLKEYINSAITTNGLLAVTESNVDEFIPFENPEELTAQQKFFIILYNYRKKHGPKVLDKMFKEAGWADALDITDEMVEERYRYLKMIGSPLVEMSFSDKVNFITQNVFQRYKGFGTPDLIFESDIDEIDIGVSGLPYGSFKSDGGFEFGTKFGYDSIWIVMHGRNVHLSCISMGSEEELERVCRQVYRYNAQQVFSRDQGCVVSSMKNGARVVVTRPPFSDKWACYVRQFDSAPAISPEVLIKGEGREIPLIISEWMVRGQLNSMITGQQGTGKTTMMKAFVGWIENMNIRTQELAFEMNLAFTYPDKNISAFQETDSISAQDGMDYQKKTNGGVNLIGEIAKAIQASHYVQSANVGSNFAMATHHAKKTSSLVDMIALNLLQLGLYKEKRDAVEVAADTINMDVHVENTDGYRHIERITEVIPVKEQLYPSETAKEKALRKKVLAYKKSHNGDDMPEEMYQDFENSFIYTDEMYKLDQREYFKRTTDRKMYETQDIVRWNRIYDPERPNDPSTGFFTLESMPSAALIDRMRSRITDPVLRDRFDSDMKRVREIDKQVRENHKMDILKIEEEKLAA